MMAFGKKLRYDMWFGVVKKFADTYKIPIESLMLILENVNKLLVLLHAAESEDFINFYLDEKEK